MSSVSCSSYDFDDVKDSVHESISLIGGLDHFAVSGDTVLLKPNLLSPKPSESAIVTHPMIVKALIELLQERGVEVVVGESSGGGDGKGAVSRTSRAFQVCGLEEVCEDTGAELVNFDRSDYEIIDSPGVTDESFPIPEQVLEADLVISLPKLKTHTLTMFTGAIKNLYGCIPGMKKTELHGSQPNPESFADMMVDILEIVKPGLSIMDGIECMHGNGPGEGGKKYNLGTVMASSDPVALDKVAESYLGFDNDDVAISTKAGDRGLGERDLENIEIVGDFVGPEEDLKRPKTGFISFLPDWFLKPIYSSLQAKPKIIPGECIGCGKCANSCPRDTIYQEGETFEIDHSDCIKCFCCQEICPEGAIEIEEKTLLRIANWFS